MLPLPPFMIRRPTCIRAFGAVLSILAACAGAARAETISAGIAGGPADDMLFVLAPKPLNFKNTANGPGREYRGIVLGDFIYYPSLYAGATFDNNLTWASANEISTFGTRFAPRLVAERDTGMHKTKIYGELDARLYPELTHGRTIGGKFGVTHIWEIERDFLFKANVEFSRRGSYADGGVVAPGLPFPVLASPLHANRLEASLALQKGFGRAFVGVTGSIAHTEYDALQTSVGRVSQSYRDSLVSTVTGRAGLWFAPTLYAYAEVSANRRDYEHAGLTSNGYRVVGGIGSDRIGLFRGEVYAGVQRQFYSSPLVADATSPVFGGRVFWYPTRALTVRMSLDQTFSDSSLPTLGNPAGLPARITTADLSLKYQMSRDWSATLRGGYNTASYLSSVRKDEGWRAGATLSYEFTRNLSLSFDYDYTRLISNVPTASHSRSVFMIGMTYRY